MRAMSIIHQARESPWPMLRDSGASGKHQRVRAGISMTPASGTRSSPGAPKPCKRMTRGPRPAPFPSTPPASLVFKPPSIISCMSDSVPDVQILKQGHEAVKRGLDHRLLIERHECAFFVGFYFIDDELNLLHADIVILADLQRLDHLPLQPFQHGGFRLAC